MILQSRSLEFVAPPVFGEVVELVLVEPPEVALGHGCLRRATFGGEFRSELVRGPLYVICLGAPMLILSAASLFLMIVSLVANPLAALA